MRTKFVFIDYLKRVSSSTICPVRLTSYLQSVTSILLFPRKSLRLKHYGLLRLSHNTAVIGLLYFQLQLVGIELGILGPDGTLHQPIFRIALWILLVLVAKNLFLDLLFHHNRLSQPRTKWLWCPSMELIYLSSWDDSGPYKFVPPTSGRLLGCQ